MLSPLRRVLPYYAKGYNMITKLRASKIAIEMPKETSEVWVHITVQKVYKDDNGNTINVIPRWNYISFPLEEIGTELFTFDDPVTQETHNNTGYGVASALGVIVIQHMLSTYGGTVTEDGDLIL